jgi:iron complex transport system substrate-binding protein
MDKRLIIGIVLALVVGLAIGFTASPTIYPPTSITITATVTTREIFTTRETVTLLTTAREIVTTPITLPITTPITTYTTIRETAVVTKIVTEVIQQTVVKEWPRVVVDALGREVKFDEPPKRVVSVAPSITEMLFVLGLGDKVVGVDRYSNWPPEVLKLVNEGRIAIIGGYYTPDIEKILSLNPDLVLLCRGARPHEVSVGPKLIEAGVKVFYLICATSRNQYDIYMDLRILGEIFGIEQRADEVVRSIQQRIDSITAKLVNVTKKPRVLQLVGPPSWGLWSAGGDTFIGWLITAAGGVNIASRYSGWPRLDYEYILSQDPEIIIVTVMGVEPKNVIDEIPGTPLVNTTAWRNGRVYVLIGEADDMLSRPGPRIADALAILAQIIHPEIFGEIKREDVVKMDISVSQSVVQILGVVATAVAEV